MWGSCCTETSRNKGPTTQRMGRFGGNERKRIAGLKRAGAPRNSEPPRDSQSHELNQLQLPSSTARSDALVLPSPLISPAVVPHEPRRVARSEASTSPSLSKSPGIEATGVPGPLMVIAIEESGLPAVGAFQRPSDCVACSGSRPRSVGVALAVEVRRALEADVRKRDACWNWNGERAAVAIRAEIVHGILVVPSAIAIVSHDEANMEASVADNVIRSDADAGGVCLPRVDASALLQGRAGQREWVTS